MPKDLRFTLLFDIYGALLTKKQRDTLEMYYNDDLSLGEISEETGITRQGVMNCVKASEQRLTELEEQLGVAERFSQLEKLTGELELKLAGAELPDGSRGEILGLLEKIREKL